MTIKTWKLREEFYRVLHQWPILLAFLLVGSLAGWAAAYIWPSYHKASAQVFVALNPYRTYSDTNFLALARPNHTNIDDYKNWQMSQLEAVIFLDMFIDKTLVELQKNDPRWTGVSNEQLRDMLETDWRSAGTWSLVARNSDPELAEQAAWTWGKIAIDEIEIAVNLAREAFMIDQEMQAIANEQILAKLRREALVATKDDIGEWNQKAINLPADQPLDQPERWQALALAARVATFTPAWMEILQIQPDSSAPPSAYTAWLEQIALIIDDEIPTVNRQLRFLEGERLALAEKYTAAADGSMGLSPNLEFTYAELTPHTPVRPTATMTIIGGLVGLLLWAVMQLVKITTLETSSHAPAS